MHRICSYGGNRQHNSGQFQIGRVVATLVHSLAMALDIKAFTTSTFAQTVDANLQKGGQTLMRLMVSILLQHMPHRFLRQLGPGAFSTRLEDQKRPRAGGDIGSYAMPPMPRDNEHALHDGQMMNANAIKRRRRNV